MQFTQLATLFGAAALVTAKNTVTFISLDKTDREVHFTPNEGYKKIDSVDVAGGKTVTADIPDEWIGNFYSISEGADNEEPGMLGEVSFQGWNDSTYFDVSAIIDSSDKDGVKEMWPADSESPTSGCENFPCDNAYYVWDDVQTKVTEETDIICTLGDGESPRKSSRDVSEDVPVAVSRDFVLVKF